MLSKIDFCYLQITKKSDNLLSRVIFVLFFVIFVISYVHFFIFRPQKQRFVTFVYKFSTTQNDYKMKTTAFGTLKPVHNLSKKIALIEKKN